MEIEAKYAVPDPETFRRLQALEELCGYALGAPQVREVHDTYLDSADRRVLATGYFCRRRQDPQGMLITLKALAPSSGAVHRREEWETTLPADSPLEQWPPGPVHDHLLQWVGDSALLPLVELDQVRQVRTVVQGERTVAEMSLDQVVFSAGGRRETALELEVELKAEGKEDDLAALATCLGADWGLVPEPRSKFKRALDLLEGRSGGTGLLQPDERAILQRIAAQEGRYGRRARALLAMDEGTSMREASRRAPLSRQRLRYWLRHMKQVRLDIFPPHVRQAATSRDEPPAGTLVKSVAEEPAPAAPPPIQLPENPGITPDDTMAEAARKALFFHLQRMLYHEPGARLGENIEELHDMRVATRRMRAALRVFGEHLDAKKMEPFAKGLRRAGRTLGAVRDLDVFHDKMQAYLDTLPPERKAELDPLLAVWQVQRERTRQELMAYLDSTRYARFKERFGRFLQTPGAGALPALTEDGDLIAQRVRYVVPVIIQERVAAVRAHGDWVAEPDAPLPRFHRLRIAGKELRYALEFFQEVLGPESKALIDTMKALQDHLGNLQDAVVASSLLRDFLTWGTWGHTEDAGTPWPISPVVAPGVATYLAVRQTEIQILVQAFPPVWAQVASSAFQKKIEAALRPLW